MVGNGLRQRRSNHFHFEVSLQDHLPLLTALKTSASRPHAPFYAPGHKRGQGIPQPLAALLGEAAFRSDLPELPELDNLFAPAGVIQAAQALAAAAFGSDRTYFLANGSTCGIQAAVLATCNPGDKLILPRNSHQAAIAALILSGAVPIFVEPEFDAHWGIAHGIRATGQADGSAGVRSVAEALAQHPDAKAILLLYPTYYGACADVAAIAQLSHQAQIPLLVDEAHAAHFGFHPDLPISALAAGADLTVQSTHKILGAMTQSSMLHLQGQRIDPERLARSLQLVQSTSPSYLLLASLDAARWQMAMHGRELMQQTLDRAAIARTQLSQIPGLRLLNPPNPATAGFTALDPTRLTVDVSGLGISGFAADEILHTELGVTAELPGVRSLTFILTLGNTTADVDQLVAGLRLLSERCGVRPPLPEPPRAAPPPLPLSSLSPRAAFFAATETVPIDQACDRIAAETVCPYPPGIPVLLPGETITPAALLFLQQVLEQGGVITGCADGSLRSLRVVQ